MIKNRRGISLAETVIALSLIAVATGAILLSILSTASITAKNIHSGNALLDINNLYALYDYALAEHTDEGEDTSALFRTDIANYLETELTDISVYAPGEYSSDGNASLENCTVYVVRRSNYTVTLGVDKVDGEGNAERYFYATAVFDIDDLNPVEYCGGTLS